MVNTYLVSNTKLFYFNYIRILVSLGLLVNNPPSFMTSTSRPFRQDQLSQKQRKIHYRSGSQRTSVMTGTEGYFVDPRVSNTHRYCTQCTWICLSIRLVLVHTYLKAYSVLCKYPPKHCTGSRVIEWVYMYIIYSYSKWTIPSMKKHRQKGSPLQPTTAS